MPARSASKANPRETSCRASNVENAPLLALFEVARFCSSNTAVSKCRRFKMPVLRPVGSVPSHEFDYVRLALFSGPEGTAHVAHGGTMGGGLRGSTGRAGASRRPLAPRSRFLTDTEPKRRTCPMPTTTHRFPLVRIANDSERADALATVDDLLTTEMDAGQEAYLDTLSALIHVYETEHHSIPDATPAEVLRELAGCQWVDRDRHCRAVRNRRVHRVRPHVGQAATDPRADDCPRRPVSRQPGRFPSGITQTSMNEFPTPTDDRPWGVPAKLSTRRSEDQ